ncbi:hypothetical protein ACF065_04405 [Streptomyces sp. NPDC015232]|uniref:hypothetical protein n=1 Tax=unclassified Streptomyces TaxID=2593676 RepID=UPI0036F84093
MTPTPSEAQRRHTRRRLLTFLILSAVLLAPPAVGLWAAAQSALEHESATDWQGNHAARLALQQAALLLVGLPLGGAVCGWTVARLRGRQARVPAAKGLLVGTMGLWLLGIGSVLVALSRGPVLVF